jgi:hypothetical protein
MQESNILFAIKTEDLQQEAMARIGRRLSEEEMDMAKDGLEWGLLFDIDTVYDTIIYEMILQIA